MDNRFAHHAALEFPHGGGRPPHAPAERAASDRAAASGLAGVVERKGNRRADRNRTGTLRISVISRATGPVAVPPPLPVTSPADQLELLRAPAAVLVDVDAALRVDGEAVGLVEFSGVGSRAAEIAEDLAAATLHDLDA